MLLISFKHNTCTITHHQWNYQFNKDFLTPPIWNSIRQLLQHTYHLTSQQHIQINNIFKKLQNEQTSNYVFTEALQRTYLIELLHFIIKLTH